MSSSKYRYSQGQNYKGDMKNFSWEYPVPIDDFWNSLDFLVGRNFLQCFSNEEISYLTFDDTLSQACKFELLLKLLQDKLVLGNTAAAPDALYDVDYPTWDKLLLVVHTVQLQLGCLDEAERTLQELIDKRKDRTSLSYLHSLSFLLEKRGDYVEAEATEKRVRIWLDEKLGKDAPQALG